MEHPGDAGVPTKHRSMQRPVASVNHARVDGPPGAMPRAIPSHTLGPHASRVVSETCTQGGTPGAMLRGFDPPCLTATN